MADIPVASLRVVESVGSDEFRGLEHIDEPVVFRGLHEGWDATVRWSDAYFRERYGDVPVPVREYAPGEEYEYTVTRQTLAGFLDYWHTSPVDAGLTGRRRYLAEWNFVRDCPGLLSDFRIPAVFADDCIERLPEHVRFGRMWLFFGEPGCSTGIHRDTFSTSAWLAVLRGSKRLRLVAPGVGRALRPGDDLWSAHTYDEVLRDSGHPLYEVTLRAGDTLYIPGDWFHQVRNPERNLMLTANFVEERRLLSFLAQFEARLTEPLAALRRLRNEHVESGRAERELDDVTFRDGQLAWVRDMTADLLDYEKAVGTAPHPSSRHVR